MSVDGEHDEAVDEEEDHIESLKQQKAKDKSTFTRIKNKLLSLLDEEDYPSQQKVKAVCQKLCEVQKRTNLLVVSSSSMNAIVTFHGKMYFNAFPFNSSKHLLVICLPLKQFRK